MTVLRLIQKLLHALGLDSRSIYQGLSARSVEAAAREQGLIELRENLRRVVPDVSDQYTARTDPREFERYWERKMRGQQAFQIKCVLDVLEKIPGQNLTLADVGDSSGNHGAYIKALAQEGKIGRIVGVNLDPAAVEKIRAKGGEAILCRAEDLSDRDIAPDLFVSFEMLEHLTDPLRFLHSLSANSDAPLLMSVPYRRDSRFGGNGLRAADGGTTPLTPESVHLLELCPADWKLLARLGGYRCDGSWIYRQYPLHHPLRLMAPVWRKLDFEGFVVLYLVPDRGMAERYTGW